MKLPTKGIYKVQYLVKSKQSAFRYQSKTQYLDNLAFSESDNNNFLNKLLVAASQGSYNFHAFSKNPPPEGCPSIPAAIHLREYQKQAVANWFANQGRGTLKMATGSGKTITALAIATELYQKIGLQVLLVVCPFRHLVTQWARECEKFGLKPILAFENVRRWQGQLSTQLYNLHTGKQHFITVITTNDTLMSEGLRSQIKYFPPLTLIVGDEAHNLGAKQCQESLPRNIGLRLALSATPERHFDEEGTQSLFEYFGTVLQPEFTLADALQQQALVHYLYYPILVELTETESRTYIKLTKNIGRILLFRERENIVIGNEEASQDLTPLLMQRARLVGAAANKLVALRQLMKKRLDTSHTLFYCGDGSVESTRQLKAVTKVLGNELGYRVSNYTAQTPLEEREELRRQFESGELQGLVAIRCLDESPVEKIGDREQGAGVSDKIFFSQEGL